MRIDYFFSAMLYAFTIAFLAIYVSLSETYWFTPTTVMLTMILVAELLAVIFFTDRRSAPLQLLLVLICLLFFIIPLIGFLLYPDIFPFGESLSYTPDDLNRVLIYVILSVGLIGVGFHLGVCSRRRVTATDEVLIARNRFYCRPAVFFIPAVASTALELYSALRYSRLTTKIENTGSGGLLFLTRLINSDVCLMVAMVLIAQHWKRYTRRERFAMQAYVLFVVLYKTMVGSRSAVLVVVIQGMILASLHRGLFRVPWKFIRWALVLGGVSVAFWMVASRARFYWQAREELGHAPTAQEFKVFMEEAEVARLPIIFVRLSGYDPTLLIINDRGRDVGEYISLKKDLQSFVNLMLPGDPFPDAYETSKTFIIVYRGYPLEYIQRFYYTSMYTLFGVSYAHFGYGLGLLFTFVCAYLSGLLMQSLSLSRSPYADYWRFWWAMTAYYLLISYGLDTTASWSAYLIIPGFILLFVLRFLSPRRVHRVQRRASQRPLIQETGIVTIR